MVPVRIFTEISLIMQQEYNITLKLNQDTEQDFAPPMQHINHFLRVLWERIQLNPEDVTGFLVHDIIEKMVGMNYQRIEKFVQRLYGSKDDLGQLEDVFHYER